MDKKDQENKKQNFWVDKFKRNVSGKVRDLRDSLQNNLRERPLEELAQITQIIGTELNQLLMPIAAIAAELLRRMKENSFTVEARARAGVIVRVEEILPTMSKDEVEAKLENLKKIIDESDAPSETKSLTFSMIKSQSSKVVNTSEDWSEVQNFEQELRRLKEK